MSKKISIKQFLMKTGKFEKAYGCIQAIRSGKISINDKTITNPNHFFNPKSALVKFSNEKIKSVAKLYFILNKPAGYLSQKSKEDKTIYDLIEKLDLAKEAKQSLFAVGRLDKDTEGLLILTNDGNLSAMATSPENEVTKKYYAVLEETADINEMKILEKGIVIMLEHERYKTKPCRIKITGEKEIYISISEGRKRQIRKMIDAIGNKVVYLRRVSIGGLQLGNLKVGDFKQLTKEEIYNSLSVQ